jgi:hypothetical protein
LLQGGAAAEGMEEEAAPEAGAKEEADARSVFVNNVDFGTTPEELQQMFAGCGTVNRVTILADKFGTPKVSAPAGGGHVLLRAVAGNAMVLCVLVHLPDVLAGVTCGAFLGCAVL